MVLGVTESLAIHRYGLAAKMLPPERRMLDSGLTSILTQLPTETVERVADMSAPMMGIIGLLMYLSRIATLERQRKENNREASAVREAERIMNQSPSQQPVQSVQTDAPSKEDLLDRFGGITPPVQTTNGPVEHVGDMPSKEYLLDSFSGA